MAIYTVNYTKKNSFMKEPRLKQKSKDGLIVNDSRYVQPGTPKARRNYVPHISYKTNKFAVDGTQEEINSLIKEIGFYDKSGSLIDSAPLNNPNAPFWKHEDLKILLENNGTTLNDEFPLDRFWIMCFKADPRFEFIGDTLPPALKKRVQYTVTGINEKLNERTKSDEESFQAMELLVSIGEDTEKMASVLRAMGVSVSNPNNAMVKSALMRKISDQKDIYVQGTSERNIEMFLRLIKSAPKELAIKDLISRARTKDYITKDAKNTYFFGDLPIGKNLTQVEEYLSDKDNSDILKEIKDKLK
jgi:hypothetical protein